MKNKWAYILIGNNDTGKTTFQKLVIRQLTGKTYQRLQCNLDFEITNRNAFRRQENLFSMNRSYQEKIGQYKSVSNYFKNIFGERDICLLSSHLVIDDIREMQNELFCRFYNVCGVFFTNSISANLSDNSDISRLDWMERLIVQNDSDSENWEYQLEENAKEFSQYVISK